jgi:capsular exopolysaccharide synthesis family protein
MKDKNRALTLPALFDKESATATEFRRLYSNIRSKAANGDLHSIMVTSSMIGEGKSLASSLLAITMADLTKAKVGLVDFDLRRPKLNIYFNTILENGVSDVLLGRVGIKDIMRKTTVPNLSVICAGKLENNPSDILDKSDLGGFIQELRYYFDYVVIDSPPVIPVSDPLLLSSHVDGILMVIRAGTTQREVVQRAVNLMKNAGVKLLGAVLNDFEDVLPYYYKDKYYGYRYYHLENSPK